MIVFLLLASAALAQAPSEDRVLGWFRAFNSGSAEEMEAFARANYAPGMLERRSATERRELYERLYATHGKLAPESIVAAADGLRVSAGRLRLSFTIEREAPHRIAGIGINIGGGDEQRPQLPPLTIPKDGPVGPAIDAYLKDLVARDEFSGSVLVAKNGEVLFEKAYGLASRRFNVPNKITTRFNVGSITKDFTKTAIAQLAQAGKLKPDAPIVTYLPDYPNKDVAQKVTVAQLVDHTSGLGDIFTRRFFEVSNTRFQSLRDFIDFFAAEPLQFHPGKGQRYSNYGYIVLGAIIEAVSGESYYDYVQNHVFDRAGMSGSGFFDFRDPVPDVAIGHTHQLPNGRSDKWLESNVRASTRGLPAGSSHSTARDLLLFFTALRGGKLMNEQWTRWFFGGDPRTSSGIFAGGAPGVNAAVASDGTWTVVVLVNVDPPIGEAMAEHVYEAVKSSSN